MGTQPSLRIGDRERDAVAAELREHFAHGRLTMNEFNQRLDAVFAAKTQAQLERITADLPHARPAGAPLPSSRSGPAASLIAADHSGRYQPIPDWPGKNWSGGDWAGRGARGRHRLAALSTLLAALASWLIVIDMMAGLRFPMPGRLGLLVAVFAIIRGLLRRIFGGARGRRFTGCRYWGRP